MPQVGAKGELERLAEPEPSVCVDRVTDADPDLSIFQTSWWLDAVTDRRWQAALVTEGERALFWLPYIVKQRLGLRVIGMPPLTPTLGPVIRLPKERPATLATLRRKLIDGAIAALPPHHGFQQVLDPSIDDALDYAINGFDVGVRYSFQIDTKAGVDELWDSLAPATRGAIRKEAQAGELVEDVDPGAYFTLHERDEEI